VAWLVTAHLPRLARSICFSCTESPAPAAAARAGPLGSGSGPGSGSGSWRSSPTSATGTPATTHTGPCAEAREGRCCRWQKQNEPKNRGPRTGAREQGPKNRGPRQRAEQGRTRPLPAGKGGVLLSPGQGERGLLLLFALPGSSPLPAGRGLEEGGAREVWRTRRMIWCDLELASFSDVSPTCRWAAGRNQRKKIPTG